MAKSTMSQPHSPILGGAASNATGQEATASTALRKLKNKRTAAAMVDVDGPLNSRPVTQEGAGPSMTMSLKGFSKDVQNHSLGIHTDPAEDEADLISSATVKSRLDRKRRLSDNERDPIVSEGSSLDILERPPHSYDPTTVDTSGSNSPGPHASQLSRPSSTSSSTPPSSLPSTTASPYANKLPPNDMTEPLVSSSQLNRATLDTQPTPERKPKKPRVVYEVEDDATASAEQEPLDLDPVVVLADDKDNVAHHRNRSHYGTYYDPQLVEEDSFSDRADDQDSIIEVYGGSPEPEIVARPLLNGGREASPTPTISSLDSDATITPSLVRQAQARSRSTERQVEPPTSPREPLSRSRSPVSLSRQSASPQHRQQLDHDPEQEQVIEVIDLTAPRRRHNYPQRDTLPRIPALSPQSSFQLPTLQRLVSRSTESVERNFSRRSQSAVDVHEILDEEDEDRFGRNTIRLDSEVREVQFDAHHPWAQGPIQLIRTPQVLESGLETMRRRRRQNGRIASEEVIPEGEDDHLAQIDYGDHESESEVDEALQELHELVEIVDDDGINERQVEEEANWILNLRRPAQRSPSFPTRASRDATPRASSNIQHRFSPVARRPSPVPLILRHPSSSSFAMPANAGSAFDIRSGSSTPRPARSLPPSQPKLEPESKSSASSQPSSPGPMGKRLKCSICLDIPVVPILTRCGHLFCRTCIHQAMQRQRHCPMCRSPLAKNKLQEMEFMARARQPAHDRDRIDSSENGGGNQTTDNSNRVQVIG